MDKSRYTLEMRCDRCDDEYGRHYTAQNGIAEGCSILSCYCEGFTPTKEDQDRIAMQDMLEEVTQILRDTMATISCLHPQYTRLGIALELVRDTKGMLSS